jgi:hypothetical protein
MKNSVLSQQILRDGGQPYVETDLGRLIVEPWNFVSAFLFVVLSVFWLYKIRNEIKKYAFLFSMLVLLLIGGTGGTIYHGFRWHRVFLMMDWMPIMLITFSASVYFFIKAWGKWWPPVFLLVIYFVIQAILFNSNLPIQTSINTSYVSMAAIVLFPIIWYLKIHQFKNYKRVLFSVILFVFALFFRWADKFVWLPAGTHFLWHIFGLGAVHFMLLFVYSVQDKKDNVLS